VIPKRQIVLLAALLALAAALQGTSAHALQVFGAQPNLTLIVLACGASLVGGVYGIGLGLWAGLLTAAQVPGGYGSLLTSFTLAGAFAGGLRRNLTAGNPLVPFLVVLPTTLVAQGVYLLMNPHGVHRWLFAALGELVYNLVLAIPLYWLLRKLGVGRLRDDPFGNVL